MKPLADDEKTFGRSDELDREVASYVSAKMRFLKIGFTLSATVAVFSLLLHWLSLETMWLLPGPLAVSGMGMFFLTCLGAFFIKRVRCPLCGKQSEIRGQDNRRLGGEQIIFICRSCQIQSPTDMAISG